MLGICQGSSERFTGCKGQKAHTEYRDQVSEMAVGLLDAAAITEAVTYWYAPDTCHSWSAVEMTRNIQTVLMSI